MYLVFEVEARAAFRHSKTDRAERPRTDESADTGPIALFGASGSNRRHDDHDQLKNAHTLIKRDLRKEVS